MDTLVESSAESAFLDLHKKLLEQGRPALAELQATALNQFEELGFPHSKHEMYTYVNTKGLVATSFSLPNKGASVSEDFVASHIYPDCKDQYLVFVDGVFDRGLSQCEGVSSNLMSLSEADEEVKAYLSETAENENDVFASLSTAFCDEGLVFKVGANTQISGTVQILFVSTGSVSGPIMHTPRIVWQLGKLSEIKVIEKFVGTEGGYFINSVQDWLLAEGAGVSYTQVQMDSIDSWHFSKVRVYLNRNARFYSSNASSEPAPLQFPSKPTGSKREVIGL